MTANDMIRKLIDAHYESQDRPHAWDEAEDEAREFLELGEGSTEREANARLNAVAPEMFKALRGLLEAYNQPVKNYEGGACVAADVASAELDARAVLAKVSTANQTGTPS